MFIIETLQANGKWWPFSYKFGGQPEKFASVREARFAYVTWKGAHRPYGTNWRVSKID
jgi:hypothetical protein